MPPFFKKFIKAKKGRRSGLRGGGVAKVESVLAEMPSTGSSATFRLDDSHELTQAPAQSLIQGWGGVSDTLIPASSTVNGPIPVTAVFSSPGNERQSGNLNVDFRQPIFNNLVENTAGTSHVPLQNTSTASYNIIVSLVPPFDGKPSAVNHFIAQCKLADSLIGDREKGFLLTVIRSRIQHHVYSRIVGENEPKTVGELIILIKNTYIGKFSLSETQSELKTVHRYEHESVEEYGIRVYEILERGVQAARERYAGEGLETIKIMLSESAVDGFLKGLRNEVVSMIINDKDMKDLRAVITLATKLEATRAPKRSSGCVDISVAKPKVLTTEVLARGCYNCGKPGHDYKRCWARQDHRSMEQGRNVSRCRKCGKVGHADYACRMRIKNRTWEKKQPSPASSTPEISLNSKGASSSGATRREPLISRAGSTASVAKPV